jgi:hypothetical protein
MTRLALLWIDLPKIELLDKLGTITRRRLGKGNGQLS